MSPNDTDCLIHDKLGTFEGMLILHSLAARTNFCKTLFMVVVLLYYTRNMSIDIMVYTTTTEVLKKIDH